MTDYIRVNDFGAKDALSTGNPNKVIFGADVDAELDAIVTANASKEDSANKGIASGYATLDSSILIIPAELPVATTTAIGALEIATVAEANAKSVSDKILVPSSIPGVLSAPGAIGDVTAGTGDFSTLTQATIQVVTEARTLTAGSGLTGGGDLSANRTLAIDITGLAEMTATPVGTDDFLYADAGVMKKMNYNQVAFPTRNAATNITFASTDVGTIVYWTGTTGTATLNSTIGQDDCYIIVVNSGSGILTLTNGTATINSANSLKALPAGGMCVLIRESSTVWFAGGGLE